MLDGRVKDASGLARLTVLWLALFSYFTIAGTNISATEFLGEEFDVENAADGAWDLLRDLQVRARVMEQCVSSSLAFTAMACYHSEYLTQSAESMKDEERNALKQDCRKSTVKMWGAVYDLIRILDGRLERLVAHFEAVS